MTSSPSFKRVLSLAVALWMCMCVLQASAATHKQDSAEKKARSLRASSGKHHARMLQDAELTDETHALPNRAEPIAPIKRKELPEMKDTDKGKDVKGGPEYPKNEISDDEFEAGREKWNREHNWGREKNWDRERMWDREQRWDGEGMKWPRARYEEDYGRDRDRDWGRDRDWDRDDYKRPQLEDRDRRSWWWRRRDFDREDSFADRRPRFDYRRDEAWDMDREQMREKDMDVDMGDKERERPPRKEPRFDWRDEEDGWDRDRDSWGDRDRDDMHRWAWKKPSAVWDWKKTKPPAPVWNWKKTSPPTPPTPVWNWKKSETNKPAIVLTRRPTYTPTWSPTRTNHVTPSHGGDWNSAPYGVYPKVDVTTGTATEMPSTKMNSGMPSEMPSEMPAQQTMSMTDSPTAQPSNAPFADTNSGFPTDPTFADNTGGFPTEMPAMIGERK